MSNQVFIFAFFILTMLLLAAKFQSSLLELQNSGSQSPILESLRTIGITIIFMTFISLILSYSLDLVYSLWTDRMLAISMLVFTFAIIPVSFSLAKGIR